MIPFNWPHITGKELINLKNVLNGGHLSGNGPYSKMCNEIFQKRYGFQKCLLTTSCTDALEMSALLLDIKAGDEVIVPSFTFVSTALAFVRQGAKIVFVDSRSDHPGMDESLVEALITPKTKAIVVVHYAGVSCDMDLIMDVAHRHGLFVIEDAALAIDSFYKGSPLGSIGNLGCFSFHESKNIQCGEGGMLVVNDERLADRSEIIWEKGTNRGAFQKGEIQKYEWVDIGSSFLLSDILAAILYSQLNCIEKIQSARKRIWDIYYKKLTPLLISKGIAIPVIPDYATNNGHLFYLICQNKCERDSLINHLKSKGIIAVFHYQSLHTSPYFITKHDNRVLKNASHYSDCLLRLPLYPNLSEGDCKNVCKTILEFYK